MHATHLKRNNIGKIVTRAAEEDCFSSSPNRITSYHFTTTETIICVHISQGTMLPCRAQAFHYSPTAQLSFELKAQLQHPKSSNTHLAARHPPSHPLVASCTGQVFTLTCILMKQINPAFSCFPV